LHIDYDDYRAGRNGICPIRPHRECQEPGKHRRRRRKAGWRRCGKEVPDKTVADMFFISAGLYPEQLPTCSLSPLGFIPNSCRHVLYLRWALSRTVPIRPDVSVVSGLSCWYAYDNNKHPSSLTGACFPGMSAVSVLGPRIFDDLRLGICTRVTATVQSEICT
jgi:hypothetical protein